MTNKQFIKLMMTPPTKPKIINAGTHLGEGPKIGAGSERIDRSLTCSVFVPLGVIRLLEGSCRATAEA